MTRIKQALVEHGAEIVEDETVGCIYGAVVVEITGSWGESSRKQGEDARRDTPCLIHVRVPVRLVVGVVISVGPTGAFQTGHTEI